MTAEPTVLRTMQQPVGAGRAITQAVASRAEAITARLASLDDAARLATSRLPGWDRLTIVCHLRYTTAALVRLTRGIVSSSPASFYPEGRDRRPDTLVPGVGESAADVLADLSRNAQDVVSTWSAIDDPVWTRTLIEPDDNQDLGPLPLVHLALLGLTEFEVHGLDLDIGLDAWSATFLDLALPFRLDWLNRRRTNHRDFDRSLRGSWLLVATDGPVWRVEVDGETVRSRAAVRSDDARAVIEASSRDLLASLLGRELLAPLRVHGDADFAHLFQATFPGP